MAEAPPTTVFLVDDDVSVRESLEMLLRLAGWRVQAFASAEDFLSRAQPKAPSCLVLDVSLPELGGLDLQARLQAGEGVAPPVVFVTGQGDIPTSVRAMKAGAADFLTKPVDPDVLLHAV